MGFVDEERFKYLRQGRSGKSPPIVTEFRGGMWRAWLEGRGHIVGFGATERLAKFNLKGLL